MRIRFVLLLASTTLIAFASSAWDPLPVRSDRKVFMPGSQQGSAVLESATHCDNCHGGYNANVEPAFNWRGSMMAHAARDPLWLASVTVALQDSIWALGNPNAGDLCIRCHTPTGWLGGRSEPTNISALSGSDFEGVSCDACHSLVDPFNALRQPQLAAETTPTGISEDNRTYENDPGVLNLLKLFDQSSFFNTGTRLPVYFGSGSLPDYVEATGGQYVVDPAMPKRGPRYDAAPKHKWYYSRLHRTSSVCGSCHDVSNPVLASLLIGAGVPERQAAASYSHVERTFSEFSLSAYGQPGGAATNPSAIVTHASTCQDCHMHDVTGYAANKPGILLRNDLALHDLTGGNVWMNSILASLDQTGAAYDSFNYSLLSGARYPGAKVDVAGLQGLSAELQAGSSRALDHLHRAADLIPVAETSGSITLRILNNTGHKLPSGYPEGRRIWLNVQFRDVGGALISEINPYTPLVISTGGGGAPLYVSGGELQSDRDDLVYEAEMSSSLTAEEETFHFVLGTARHKDNRIPPKGFDIARAPSRMTQPRWDGVDASGYFTSTEYTGGFDDVEFGKPVGTASWTASLYYQTTSREYIEFLTNEINGTAASLSSPTPSGEPAAYIAQADPFFSTLRDWGRAIQELWLHNDGAAPILMASATGGSSSSPPIVSTGAATSVSPTGATLNGTVNPNGKATSGWFQLGTTVAYGTTTSSQSLGSGSSDVPLTQAISGLTCNTLYHFRAVAQNSDGTPNGLDQTFTTSICESDDFNGDGRADLVWRNTSTGDNSFWFMQGTNKVGGGGFEPVADVNWKIVATGDFDGNGQSDLAWRNTSTGQNAIWIMNGNTRIGSGTLDLVADQNWQIVGSADLNSDGKADLIWRNGATGENAFWLISGLVKIGGGSLDPVADTTWKIAGAGDFDGDGKGDLAWWNSAAGDVVLWLMNGTSRSANLYVSRVADTQWELKGVGDFSGDGKADLAWRNKNSGDGAMWMMNGASLVTGGYFGTVSDLNWSLAGAR